MAGELDKILRRIGKKVSCKFPGKRQRKGILKDRAVVKSTKVGTVPYWDVVDLIKFDKEKPRIRIGYYRKSKNRLIWGSQTTITESVSGWKKLLVNVAR